MDNETLAQVTAAETELRQAMLDSDVDALDRLLADDLIFTNHMGQLMTKQDDVDAHRSGFVKIDTIELSDQQVRPAGDAAVVSVASRIDGTFGSARADVTLRFTRIWRRTGGSWQLIAAHSTVVG